MSSDTKAAFSIPSILAIVAAIISFKASAVFGLVLAGVAIVFGVLGMILSLGPKTRGGIASLFGIGGGLLGIVVAFVKIIRWALGAG